MTDPALNLPTPEFAVCEAALAEEEADVVLAVAFVPDELEEGVVPTI